MQTHELYSELENLSPKLLDEISDFVKELKKKKTSFSDRKPVFGSAKGMIEISEDFDEPLEDFKNYM